MRTMSYERPAGASPLARVRLAENERRDAEHYLQLGERIADLILGVAAAASSAVHSVERGLRTLAGSRSTG